MRDDVTVTLYRPVGPQEMALIRDSGFQEVPPRLPEQPIFYPVLNEQYAVQIARDWNAKSAANVYLSRYEIQTVGSRKHQEYWIPASDLPQLNRNIVGEIEVIQEFQRSP